MEDSDAETSVAPKKPATSAKAAKAGKAPTPKSAAAPKKVTGGKRKAQEDDDVDWDDVFAAGDVCALSGPCFVLMRAGCFFAGGSRDSCVEGKGAGGA